MSEKDRPKQPTYSMMPPGETDPTAHLRNIRKRAIQRVIMQERGIIQARDTALAKMERLIHNISESPASSAVDRAFNNEKYVLDVLGLTQRIEEVIQKITFILSLFGSTYPHNDELGLPAGHKDNINRLRTNLGVALKHLRGINVDPRNVREDFSMFAPDHELITHLGELNEKMEGNGEIDHSREIVAIMNTLDEFLTGIITATHMGITFTVVTTREKLDRHDTEAALILAAEEDMDDLFTTDPDETSPKQFFDLLREIEFTLANCTIRIAELHQKNAIWLLTQVKVRTLQTITRSVQTRIEQMEQQIAAMQDEFMREPGWMERTGSRLFGKKADAEKPTATAIKLKRQDLERHKQTLTLLRKILHIRIQQELR